MSAPSRPSDRPGRPLWPEGCAASISSRARTANPTRSSPSSPERTSSITLPAAPRVRLRPLSGACGALRSPGRIEGTAEEVTRRGGRGIAVRCDQTSEAEVQELFARIDRESGGLDILVNNAWGGHQHHVTTSPFWTQPLGHWDAMFNSGVRNHILAARAGSDCSSIKGVG
ncbi:SDR family NAD(P)-dependent oxidoreductase [Mesorhizobium sp. M0663]|uniref:SDR family NAD(P)-dependent oxidoreductase n=1 Tax=Mesorhizobium sp. M0663 TaxID=2956981 RepID=UPI0033361433